MSESKIMPVDMRDYLESLPDGEEKRILHDAYDRTLTKIVPVVLIPGQGGTYTKMGKCPSCSKSFSENYGKVKCCPDCGQRIMFT